ncbi:hypothetical protein AB0K52_03395 [Glycomyces sp. NPDC049804]|uniref:hypothetical protein n=1 Tax=Glycomyces sp. NPDC049804 TaxID=3154363 RepID=UPI00342B3368
MTMPPPPPDRMHLQYRPAPPPPPGPQQMGPGGAYGPAQYSPEQPVPGQLPVGLSMSKPGTVTGIQVILYIFLAVSVVGNVFSVMSMVELFNPFSLIGLAFAVYSAIQSLASGVQIARGKRWAWIWSLVSAILGLALSLTGFVFGVVMFDSGGDIMLTVAAVLVGLYGTLLGLLCSKSARQWILMHRIQRGEVPIPGAAMGGMPGAAPMGAIMAPQGASGPERPATRPGAATFTAVAMLLLAALSVWNTVNLMRFVIAYSEYTYSLFDAFFVAGTWPPFIFLTVFALCIVCPLITAPLILKGRAGGRIFGVIWSVLAVLGAGLILAFVTIDYIDGMYDLPPLPGQVNPVIPAFGWSIGRLALALLVFILLLTPGVRAWTPGKPPTPLIMVVQEQPQAPQQTGPYGQAPQQQYPPQPQSPYGGY